MADEKPDLLSFVQERIAHASPQELSDGLAYLERSYLWLLDPGDKSDPDGTNKAELKQAVDLLVAVVRPVTAAVDAGALFRASDELIDRKRAQELT